MGNKKEKIFNNLLNLLEENQKLILPLKVSKGTVKEDWIDYNGHMNMAYYVQCFEESSDFLLEHMDCLLYTSPSPRDGLLSRMPSSA